MQEGLVHDADHDAITYVKPEGTMHFIAGMVDAFPARQVLSYLVIGLRRGIVVHNYIGMAAKLKGKSLIVAVYAWFEPESGDAYVKTGTIRFNRIGKGFISEVK